MGCLGIVISHDFRSCPTGFKILEPTKVEVFKISLFKSSAKKWALERINPAVPKIWLGGSKCRSLEAQLVHQLSPASCHGLFCSLRPNCAPRSISSDSDITMAPHPCAAHEGFNTNPLVQSLFQFCEPSCTDRPLHSAVFSAH